MESHLLRAARADDLLTDTGIDRDELQKRLSTPHENADMSTLWDQLYDTANKSQAETFAEVLSRLGLQLDKQEEQVMLILQLAEEDRVWLTHADASLRTRDAWTGTILGYPELCDVALKALSRYQRKSTRLKKIEANWTSSWYLEIGPMLEKPGTCAEDLQQSLLDKLALLSDDMSFDDALVSLKAKHDQKSILQSRLGRRSYMLGLMPGDLASLHTARSRSQTPAGPRGSPLRRNSQESRTARTTRAARQPLSPDSSPSTIQQSKSTSKKRRKPNPVASVESSITSAESSPMFDRNSDQESSPMTPQSKSVSGTAPTIQNEDIHSPDVNYCKECKGDCRICWVPEVGAQLAADELQEIAHAAEKFLPDSVTRIMFASFGSFDNSAGDVYRATSQELDLIGSRRIDKPVLIEEYYRRRYTFEDTLQRISDTYGGAQLSVRKGDNPEPALWNGPDVVDRFLRRDPDLNALDLADVTEADAPTLTSERRFQLLSELTNKHPGQDSAGKQTVKLPSDLASCRRWTLCATQGAWSPPHMDLLMTWVRLLDSLKLWWIFPESSTDPGEARAIVLNAEHNTILMPHGCRHQVLTIQPAAVLGGMVLDRQDCATALRVFREIAEDPAKTNEPLPHQLPAICAGLEEKLGQPNDIHDAATLLETLASFKAEIACHCQGQCGRTCPCKKASRRCLDWCNEHTWTAERMAQCMTER